MKSTAEQFEQVASGLAESGFGVVDQFLTISEIDQILQLEEFRKGISEFNKAGVGKQFSKVINESVRGDYIRWVDEAALQPELKVYLNRIGDLIQYLNQSLFLSLKDFEMHMTVYPTGSFYRRHKDQFRENGHRKLSVILYLNKDWKEELGGQLRMHLPTGRHDIFPIAGRLVCFRSEQIEHEVIEAKKERLSLTGWILDQFVGLRHL